MRNRTLDFNNFVSNIQKESECLRMAAGFPAACMVVGENIDNSREYMKKNVCEELLAVSKESKDN